MVKIKVIIKNELMFPIYVRSVKLFRSSFKRYSIKSNPKPKRRKQIQKNQIKNPKIKTAELLAVLN
jgi:hypothetical protein